MGRSVFISGLIFFIFVPLYVCDNRTIPKELEIKFFELLKTRVFVITNDIIKTSNEVPFKWVVGGRIHDEIIYDLRVNDFIGVLAKDEFAKLPGKNETVPT